MFEKTKHCINNASNGVNRPPLARVEMSAIELFMTGTVGINASSSYIIIHLIYIYVYVLSNDGRRLHALQGLQ